MTFDPGARWVVWGATFALAAAMAASAVYWGLKLTSRPGAASAASVATTPGLVSVDATQVARVLGALPQSQSAPSAPPLASRFALQGVVAAASGGVGAALIAVDGKPARPYRVGRPIEDGVVLKSVQGRRAVLASTPGGSELATLEMPTLKR